MESIDNALPSDSAVPTPRSPEHFLPLPLLRRVLLQQACQERVLPAGIYHPSAACRGLPATLSPAAFSCISLEGFSGSIRSHETNQCSRNGFFTLPPFLPREKHAHQEESIARCYNLHAHPLFFSLSLIYNGRKSLLSARALESFFPLPIHHNSKNFLASPRRHSNCSSLLNQGSWPCTLSAPPCFVPSAAHPSPSSLQEATCMALPFHHPGNQPLGYCSYL